jgi:DNA polymerase-3 subunit delta'
MNELILHPETEKRIGRLIADPAHAVLLIAPSGSGKHSIALNIAGGILNQSTEQLIKHPYFMTIAPIDGKAIPIETIRELQHFTTLRIPGGEGISRVVIIESAELMTMEAQNALLKTLEEPPMDTVFILTAPAADTLLPTIQSRVRTIFIATPELSSLKNHLLKNFQAAEIDKALLVSGGLPGLTHALLTDPEAHPLYMATLQARTLLQSTVYERLLLVDSLSKQKELCRDIVFILGQMSRMALVRGQGSAGKRWQNIMKAAFAAQESLHKNTQTKLVLINLMLEM